MTLDQAAVQYKSQRVAYNGRYKGECLSLIKQAITDVYHIQAPASGNGAASGYWINFPNPLPKYFTRESLPQVGDIVVFNTFFNPVKGHIAIVSSVDSSGFTSWEQNNPVGSGVHQVRHIIKNVYGFLRPKTQEKEISPMSVVNDGDTINEYVSHFDRQPTQAELDKNRNKEWNNPDPELRAPLYTDMQGRARYLTEENKRLQKLVDVSGIEARVLPPGNYTVK